MIREKVDAALAALGNEMGLQLKLGNGRFDSTTGHFKMDVATKGESGEFQSKEAEAFTFYATAYDLKPEFLNQEFESVSVKYKLTGFNGRARKNKFIAERVSDGKEYVFPEHLIQYAFKGR